MGKCSAQVMRAVCWWDCHPLSSSLARPFFNCCFTAINVQWNKGAYLSLRHYNRPATDRPLISPDLSSFSFILSRDGVRTFSRTGGAGHTLACMWLLHSFTCKPWDGCNHGAWCFYVPSYQVVPPNQTCMCPQRGTGQDFMKALTNLCICINQSTSESVDQSTSMKKWKKTSGFSQQ